MVQVVDGVDGAGAGVLGAGVVAFGVVEVAGLDDVLGVLAAGAVEGVAVVGVSSEAV